jgi:hypothetical protein
MRKEIKVLFNKGKYFFDLRIVRLHYKSKRRVGRIDALAFLSMGYGDLVNRFARGFYFYIDRPRFDVGENYQAKGFSIPIKSGLQSQTK